VNVIYFGDEEIRRDIPGQEVLAEIRGDEVSESETSRGMANVWVVVVECDGYSAGGV